MAVDDAQQTGSRPHRLQEALTDLARCLRFYSRLPVPALLWEPDPYALPDFRTIARLLPVAGVMLGLGPALVLAGALALELGPFLAAALSVAAMTVITGAFHEDGLADTMDGFGGGATPERRLAIMRDSLIGSFGASALALAFALRIAALGTLADRLDPMAVTLAVMIVASLSRTAGLIPLTLLPPARLEGASHAVGRPTREALWQTAAIAVMMAAALGFLANLPASGILLMVVLPALAGILMTRLSARMIGGQTGDVAGAIQQIAEIGAMIGLLTVVEP